MVQDHDQHGQLSSCVNLDGHAYCPLYYGNIQGVVTNDGKGSDKFDQGRRKWRVEIKVIYKYG